MKTNKYEIFAIIFLIGSITIITAYTILLPLAKAQQATSTTPVVEIKKPEKTDLEKYYDAEYRRQELETLVSKYAKLLDTRCQ